MMETNWSTDSPSTERASIAPGNRICGCITSERTVVLGTVFGRSSVVRSERVRAVGMNAVAPCVTVAHPISYGRRSKTVRTGYAHAVGNLSLDPAVVSRLAIEDAMRTRISPERNVARLETIQRQKQVATSIRSMRNCLRVSRDAAVQATRALNRLTNTMKENG